jgi:hypothetical protein
MTRFGEGRDWTMKTKRHGEAQGNGSLEEKKDAKWKEVRSFGTRNQNERRFSCRARKFRNERKEIYTLQLLQKFLPARGLR